MNARLVELVLSVMAVVLFGVGMAALLALLMHIRSGGL